MNFNVKGKSSLLVNFKVKMKNSLFVSRHGKGGVRCVGRGQPCMVPHAIFSQTKLSYTKGVSPTPMKENGLTHDFVFRVFLCSPKWEEHGE